MNRGESAKIGEKGESGVSNSNDESLEIVAATVKGDGAGKAIAAEFSDEGLRREEPLENSFGKKRIVQEKGEKREAESDQRSRHHLAGHRPTSYSHSHTGEDEDLHTSGIMEEKSIMREGNNEKGDEIENRKAPDEKEEQKGKEKKKLEAVKNPSDEEDEDEEDDDQDSNQAITEGLYDPNEFANLPVGSDIKEIFQFISAYTPQVIEIDTVLKPFVLDYLPAVGDIDAFIKIPRPDDVEDNLGLIVLDEPCAKQSDPTVLDLHLRATSKENLPRGTVVKRLARAERNPKEIENWIKNIGELHKSKPPTQVHYSKPMPDIDALMQEWPAEVEETLKQIDLPSADLDLMPLEQYVDAACAILDIPVYKSRIQSLHVLFTLYSEFKNSQHFRALAEENRTENVVNARTVQDTADRLVL